MCNSNYGRIYNVLIAFVFISFSSFKILTAQQVQVDTRLDTNQILIGDQINLYLEVIQPEKARVLQPNLEKKLPPGVEILKAEKPDTVKFNNEEQLKIKQRFLITSFDTGDVFIPSMTFRYEYNSQLDSIISFPEKLTVQTVQVDTTKTIFDIKKPFGAPVTFAELLPYIGGLLGLIIIALVVYYYWKYLRKKTPEKEAVKPSEPAHVIAFRDLNRLKEQELWQKGHVKLYYTQLTEILRNYLWLRYDIKTLERTTDEILGSLRNTDLHNEELFQKLEETLRTADLVKFAKWTPESAENEDCMKIAYEFVEQTKLVEKKEKEQEVNELTEETSKNKEE